MTSSNFTKNEVVAALSKHVGKSKGVSSTYLLSEITGHDKHYHADDRYLRKMITELRLEGMHICSSPAYGYYIAADEKELKETCELLFIRSMKTLRQITAMKNIAMPDLRGQLHLQLQKKESKDVTA